MIDGLYLNNTWVCGIDFSLTLQGNDLTQPDARLSSFSNTFQLPDSLAMRDLLESGEQLDAGGVHPYRQLPAFVVDEGEVTFRGFAELISFQAGWKVNLYDTLLSFFDQIKDKPLTSLNLSYLDHPWNIDHINLLAGSSSGVVYPMIDYGGIDAGIVPYDTMCPGVYVKDLFGQIAKEAGYTPVGDFLTDPFFEAMALPFANADPKAHDDQWVTDRTARVTTSGNPSYVNLEDGHPIDLVLPFSGDTINTLDYGLFEQGKIKPFNSQRHSYVCPEDMRVNVQAQVMFISLVKFGAADIRLELWKNGTKVAETYYSKGGYYDGLDIAETLQLDESIDCLKGDELFLKLTGSSRTNLSDYKYSFLLNSGETWASFTPDPAVHFGDYWPVAQNLPADISCSDLALTLAKVMQGTYVVDDTRKTVRLVPLDDVIKNIPNAKDWSQNVDESVEPELTVQFEGYTTKNWCKWKENDDKAYLGYGDGYLTCDNSPNKTESTLFELPFMAAVQSETVVGGYGKPILIKTRTITSSGGTTNVDKNDAAARIILTNPAKTVQVQTATLDSSGNVVNVPVKLTGCWWAVRPDGIRTDDTDFSLAFSPVIGQVEEPLLVRYFGTLKRVLRRPRMLNASVYLQPSDIATLDLSVPIRLQKVRLGSLDINDNLFYLNKLGPYRSGMVCNTTLIAI